MQFTKLFGKIVSTPVVANESPFELFFHAQVQGDIVPVHFMGDFARALRSQIVFGDSVYMNGMTVENGELVVGFLTMERLAAKGRNIDVEA